MQHKPCHRRCFCLASPSARDRRSDPFLLRSLSSTLALSGGSSSVGHQFGQALLEGLRFFGGSCACPPSRIIVPPQDRACCFLGPEDAPDGSEAVRKGWLRLLVPGRAEHPELLACCGQFGRPQGYQREHAEQQRRGPVNGLV